MGSTAGLYGMVVGSSATILASREQVVKWRIQAQSMRANTATQGDLRLFGKRVDFECGYCRGAFGDSVFCKNCGAPYAAPKP